MWSESNYDTTCVSHSCFALLEQHVLVGGDKHKSSGSGRLLVSQEWQAAANVMAKRTNFCCAYQNLVEPLLETKLKRSVLA
jgi:hypothetical protein